MTAFLSRFRLAPVAALIATLIVVLPCPGHAAANNTVTADRLGTIPYALPQGKPSDVIVLFAGDPHDHATQDATARLTALGAAVAVVDSDAYLATLASDKGDCVWLSSDIEELNRTLQRKLGFPEFRLPVLASIGKGGALVYGLLAEAPSYSFAGGVSVGFTPSAPAHTNICGVGLPEAGAQDLLPTVDVKVPWKVQLAAGEQGHSSDWVNDVDKAELIAPDTSQSAPQNLAELVRPILDSAVSKDPNSLEDLPLIEIPTGKPSPYVAIVYSGDGGWRDLDRTLGQILAAHGVPVVGVDSLLYFWQPQRPEVVAHDLDRIIDHYRQAWKIDHFVLVGYSFGADILPFAYNRMTDENRKRVSQLSLLALSRNTRFEISVSEYFSDKANAETRPIEPELAKISPSLIQCFYGADEADDSACTTQAAAKDELIRTEGGHHFGDDYDALADRIMQGAARRIK